MRDFSNPGDACANEREKVRSSLRKRVDLKSAKEAIRERRGTQRRKPLGESDLGI